MVMKRVEYPISKDYCGNWTVKDALRELIANAIDASQDVDLNWIDGEGYIRDFGGGLDKKALLVGFSSKDAAQIGQFGEGLKIAALVLCRDGRSVEVRSRNVILSFAVEWSQEFDDNVLVAYHDVETESITGTMVKIGCSRDEFNEASNLFVRLRNIKTVPVEVDGATSYILPEEPGKIYIMGVFVAQDKTLYGYDLHFKALMNRDRTILMQGQLRDAISRVWNRCDDSELIESFLEKMAQARSEQEVSCSYQIRDDVIETWKQAMVKMFGKRTCRGEGSNAHLQTLANERNWTVLRDLPYTVDWLFKSLGMPTLMSVFNNGVLREGRVLHGDLSDQERMNLAVASDVIWGEFGKCGRINIFERLDVDDIVQARPTDDGIEIRRSVLGSMNKTVECLLHEAVHKEHNCGDCTVQFENAMMERYAKAAIALHYAQKGDEKSRVGAC